MKKRLALIFILTLFSIGSVSAIICSDSDMGSNFYTRAYSRGELYTGETIEGEYEECVMQGDKEMLKEWYCDDEGTLRIYYYECPNGCQDGACSTTPGEIEMNEFFEIDFRGVRSFEFEDREWWVSFTEIHENTIHPLLSHCALSFSIPGDSSANQYEIYPEDFILYYGNDDNRMGAYVKEIDFEEETCTVMIFDEDVDCQDFDNSEIVSQPDGGIWHPFREDIYTSSKIKIADSEVNDYCANLVTYEDLAGNDLIKYERVAGHGDSMMEMGCLDGELPYKVTRSPEVCTGGCQDGACIGETTSDGCYDSDGGLNPHKKGTASGVLYNGDIIDSVSDTCTIISDDGQTDVEFCKGENCRLTEWWCDDETLKVDYNLECPEGCQDGACTEEIEEVDYSLCTSSDLWPDMVAWYSANKNSKDKRGDHDGEKIGDVRYAREDTWDKPGVLGSSFSFDDETGYISVPHSDDFNFGTGQFTLEAWIKTKNLDEKPRHIVGKRDSEDSQEGKWARLFTSENGKIFFELTDGWNIKTDKEYDDGSWHHLVGMRRPDGRVLLYIDGTLVKEGRNSVDVSNQAPLTIGGWKLEDFFQGKIDEVAIYEKALTFNEIEKIYETKGIGKCLIGHISCFDTDGGSYNVPGIAVHNDVVGYDVCKDENILSESLCLSDTGNEHDIVHRDHECPNGCVFGACIPDWKIEIEDLPEAEELWPGSDEGCDGCKTEAGECVAYGARVEDKFCSQSLKRLAQQYMDGSTCESNFECQTGNCVSGTCRSSTEPFSERFVNWIKRLFGFG